MTVNITPAFDAEATAERLVGHLAAYDSVVIAFSGGVDSAVVAAAAQRALGDRAIAVMAVSPSVPERQRELAEVVADEIGITFKAIETTELDSSDYVRNDTNRCFFCKQTLYAALRLVAQQSGDAYVLSGTNFDDLGDHRPGIEAGNRAGVLTPLAELQLTKDQVRGIARFWGLSVWNLPAGPCLASRIAYGESVTIDKLRMIDAAENWLKDQGIRELRVRLHVDSHARIEVPEERISDLVSNPFRGIMNAKFRSLGFRYISVDTEGFRSGSFNQMIPVDALLQIDSDRRIR